jgi:HlyD family secretion protein
MKKALFLVLVLAGLGLGGWRWRALNEARAAEKVTVPTGAVTQGRLVVTLPVTGALESAEETEVRSEIAGTLTHLYPDNTPVKAGDVIYQMDTKDLDDQREQQSRAVTDAQEALDTQIADNKTRLTQAQSDTDVAAESLKLTQEQAQAERERIAAQVQFAEGQTARSLRELVRAQKLASKNYIAGTKLRDAEKAYRKQQFDLEQQKGQQADVEKRTGEQIKDQDSAYKLSQHSLDTAKVDAISHEEDARIDLAEAERKLAEVDKKIAQCTVVAPVAGLATIQTNDNNWPERRPFRLGDAMEHGAAPIKIYDVNRMQVRCQIGEMDISRVHKGQSVWVTTPAQPDHRYKGTVEIVEELAREANVWQGGTPGKKTFGLLITLAESDPARLRPGMTVDLEIVLDSVREATMAPIRAVFAEKNKHYVYKAVGDGFVRTPVTLGTRNDLLIEVRGGIKVGDKLALALPPMPPAGHGKGKP